MNGDMWQWIAVGVIVVWALWRIAVNLRSKQRKDDGSCGSGCSGCDASCPLKDEEKR